MDAKLYKDVQSPIAIVLYEPTLDESAEKLIIYTNRYLCWP